MKPTLQKGQSTKHISTHHNLHITTYNKNLQYATYREIKRLKLTASGVTLGYIDKHYRE